MKKITTIAAILSALFIISCSNDGGDDTETGYVDPGSWSGKFISPIKEYSIAGESCGPDDQCNAIIYRNKLNDTNYTGIAVNDGHSSTPPSFNLKIYWEATTIPTGAGLTLNSCTAVINDQKVENITINSVTINDVTPGGSEVTVYEITFGTGFSVGTESISNGDSITAVKYP